MGPTVFYDHPLTTFIKAFSEGQHLAIAYTSFGNDWPLFKFWSNKVAPLQKVMDNFMEPLMENAFAKRNLELAEGTDNLLVHLVRDTQGNQSLLRLFSIG